MNRPWYRLTVVLGFCGLVSPALMADTTVEVQPEAGEQGQDCRRYQYKRKDLAEQRESRLVFDAFEEHKGKTIRHIRYESRDIFDESDPDEDNWLYRGLNELHINTREPVIAGQLLFAEKEPLNIRLIKESERILRSRNYLTSAYIVPDVICPDYMDILVVTRDAWVAEPELNFSHEGGESSSSIGIKDGNFLGTGDDISISYASDVERTSVSYEYKTPHLFQSRWAARVYFAERSDGEDRVLKLERPFFALDTPWAAGGETQQLNATNVIREGGEEISEYRHRMNFQEVYGGLAVQRRSQPTLRVLAGLTREKDQFYELEGTRLGVPDDQSARYAWLGASYIDTEFATYKNLNQIQRTEDVALGVNYHARLGYGSKGMGNDRDLMRYAGRYNRVIGVGDHHILQWTAMLDGYRYVGADGFDTGTAGVDVSYNLFEDDQNRWYARLRYTQGWNLLQHEELTVGGALGLRGYPLDYQRGEHLYLLNIERRYFSDIHLFNLVRMGAVAFLDFGRAWGLERDNASNAHLSNVGIGFRFSSSKTQVGNVLHIDIAAPLVEKSGLEDYQVLIKGATSF